MRAPPGPSPPRAGRSAVDLARRPSRRPAPGDARSAGAEARSGPRVSSGEARRASRSVDPGLVVAFLAALAIAGFALARHAMWFDELQAWNIARASGSLPDLFHHLRYEGHPAAWYLGLYGVTR